jgi:hypothetical protein
MNLKLYFTKNELTMILANADVISDNSIILNSNHSAPKNQNGIKIALKRTL